MSSSANGLEAAAMKTADCLESTVVGPHFSRRLGAGLSPPDPHGHSRLFKADVLKKQAAGCVFMSRRNRPAATGKWNSSG
jgi:hypothetical protein